VDQGTQDGTETIVKGAGMQKVTKSGQTGDHVVTLRIEVPKQLTAGQAEALRRYAKLRNE